MFFSEDRSQFFRPLTSKYREQILECLRLLYERLYSARADYGESLQRDQVIEIFEEALARAPQLDSGDYGNDTRFKSEREQASWILNQLLEYGWLEKQVDQATLQSTFPFTRIGRMITQSLSEMGASSVRTRHRNTRNTLNALEAFLARGEVHDLMDAYEYSERIISDFTDVIAELEERKRELVRQVETQLLVQQATEHFFEFMEKRFQPDVSIRLSADSVEKHRDGIQSVIDKIRRKRKDFKREAELKLRELAPELVQHNQSLLYFVLDAIEICMCNAAELMLPALRRALQSFTKRADIIIRQLSYLTSQRNNSVVDVCRDLAQLGQAQQDQILALAGAQLSGLNLRWLDPEQVRLQQKRQQRVLYTRIEDAGEIEDDALREVALQQQLDRAFITHNEGLHDYLITAMAGNNKVSTKDLPLLSARDVLAMSHAVETASYQAVDSEYQFVVTPTGETASNEYFDRFDVFDIELIKKSETNPDLEDL